jgi:hypothetical protein
LLLFIPSPNLFLFIYFSVAYPPQQEVSPKTAWHMVDGQQTFAKFIFVCNSYLLPCLGALPATCLGEGVLRPVGAITVCLAIPSHPTLDLSHIQSRDPNPREGKLCAQDHTAEAA